MYIDVIPLDNSFWNHSLTYGVRDIFRERVFPGGIVQIPFWKKEISGIISRKYLSDQLEKSDNQIKEIIDIVTEMPLFDSYQITMMERIAKKYLLPLHKVARIFFPRSLEKRLEKKWYPQIQHFFQNTGRKDGIFLSQNTILQPKQLWDSFSEKSILIVPDDRSLMQFVPHKTENDLFLWNESTDIKKSDAWIDIMLGKYSRIVWTRRLLAYNLSGYTKILYFEDAFSHEYYHYPVQIQYTDMLTYLYESWKFSLEIWTSIPRLQTLATFHHLPITYIND